MIVNWFIRFARIRKLHTGKCLTNKISAKQMWLYEIGCLKCQKCQTKKLHLKKLSKFARKGGVNFTPSWNQRTRKNSWRIGLNKHNFWFIEPCVTSFQQKLHNGLRELRDQFFARHFLHLIDIVYNPWVFCYKKSL